MAADPDPPSAVQSAPPGYRFAGPWIRWVASLIDNLLLGVVVGIFAFVARLLFDVDPFGSSARTIGNVVINVVLLAWLAGWQAAIGASPGMLALKLRVLGPGQETGPSLLAAVVRNLPMVLASFAVMSTTSGTLLALVGPLIYIAVFITIAISPTQQGFHDRIAGGTHVVRRASVYDAENLK